MRRLFLALATVLLLATCERAPPPVEVQILAINDLHGHLLPPPGGLSGPAGGIEYMATLVAGLRAANPNTIMVAAGDLIGASPLLSALFHDEPTVQALSAMGLEASAAGNHEFDEGRAELLRIQNGGCHPADGCKGPRPFAGAGFQYLAANVFDAAAGQTILPSTYVKTFEGVPVAFIGLTLEAAPAAVISSGTAGLEFRDEAETVNALIPELRAQGIEAIVVLIHEGGMDEGDYNECRGLSGPIVEIVAALDPAVDAIVSGHTHAAYNCVIDGRLVTSAHRFGTLVTRIDLSLDPVTRDVVSAAAENLLVSHDIYARDPEITGLIAAYDALAAPLANRVAGRVIAPIGRNTTDSGEMAIGDVIADAHLAATAAPENGGAVAAFTNPGGIRTEIVKGAGENVTYADLFSVQPFSNSLVTMNLSGAQLKTMLEQQWSDPAYPRILQVSNGFAYAWDDTRPLGDRVLAETMRLDGAPIATDSAYRIAVNSFLAEGGDGFAILREGTQRQFGILDIDALESYFAANSPVAPPPQTRIRRAN